MFRMSEFIFIVIFLMTLFTVIVILSIRKTMKNVPIVVGVLNRENTIECELRKMIKSNRGGDIVVVDWGSGDDTLEIIKKLSFDHECIRLISLNEKNNGDIISKILKQHTNIRQNYREKPEKNSIVVHNNQKNI